MNIVSIFDVVQESLYSVLYNNESEHEFRRLFNLWNDSTFLEDFFEAHKEDLYGGFWGNVSIEEAILQTSREAARLENQLLQIAQAGNTSRYDNLSTLFKPLYNGATKTEPLELNKVKGEYKKSWLRIYAIRVDANVFVVSGGAIKLTPTMNNREHLLQELEKLRVTREYLKDEENDTLDIFELS